MSYLIVSSTFTHRFTSITLHPSPSSSDPIVFSACLSLKYCRLPETDSSSAQTAGTVCSVLCLCQVKVSVSKRRLCREFIPSHPNPQHCLFRLYKLDLTSAAAVYRVVGSLYAKQDVIYGNAWRRKVNVCMRRCIRRKCVVQLFMCEDGGTGSHDLVSQSSVIHTNNIEKIINKCILCRRTRALQLPHTDVDPERWQKQREGGVRGRGQDEEGGK